MNYINQLHQYMSLTASLYPNKTAIIVDSQRCTYAELDQKSSKFANILKKLGCLRGDRILLCLENSLEAVVAFWGALKADLIVTLISPELQRQKIIYIADDLAAKFVVFADEIDYLEELKVKCSTAQIIFINSCYFNDYMNNAKATNLINQQLDIDLATILYTSGSTGIPKGVMLTHRNMLTASASIQSYLKLQSNDIIISALPMSFDYGLYQLILSVMNGATLVLERNFSWPLQFLKKAVLEQATVVPGVPTFFSIMDNHLTKYHFDLSAVRIVTNTGAALLKKHIAVIKSFFSNAAIFSMYGLTECKRCTYLPPEHIDSKSDSVGVAIPNTEIWIVDDKGVRLPPMTQGQLVIRGGTVMQGYWDKPDETSEVLKPGLLPNENILYTGDYGYVDEGGYFYFFGRKDEVVKCLGQKVSLRKIEEIIYSLPGVRETAVIATSDENKELIITAYISIKEDNAICENTILEICKNKLEKTHWPNKIIILSGLPKNINGKVDKLVLTKMNANCRVN